jgi:putative hydrolase of the HAD superfamily
MSEPINAVLFDLGNVVLELDVRRVFARWAELSGEPIDALRSRWVLDDAYKRHEVGELNFHDYAVHLGGMLGIELSTSDWRNGWNALFRGPFPEVAARLPGLSARLPCFCFTNTNPTHQAQWQSDFPTVIADFRKIYVSSEIGRRKPEPESYRWVASDMGFAPHEIHFIDDSRENVDGAISAGMRATLVRSEADVVAAMEALLS